MMVVYGKCKVCGRTMETGLNDMCGMCSMGYKPRL